VSVTTVNQLTEGDYVKVNAGAPVIRMSFFGTFGSDTLVKNLVGKIIAIDKQDITVESSCSKTSKRITIGNPETIVYKISEVMAKKECNTQARNTTGGKRHRNHRKTRRHQKQ